MTPNNSYSDKLSIEYGIILEKMKWTTTAPLAKVYVPILMPYISGGTANTYKDTYTNSVGKSLYKKSKATVELSNYIELKIPSYMYPPVRYDSKGNPYYLISKGTKAILAFIGNTVDIDYIKIIGLDI